MQCGAWCAHAPWKVQPLLLQVRIQSLHDLVQELHAPLQLLVEVGHLGGFKYLRGWVRHKKQGAGGAVGGAV